MGIQFEKIEAVVKAAGLTIGDQLKSYHDIRSGKYAVYLSKREKCGRVDLSGFSIRHPAVKLLDAERAAELKLGRVKGQLDFSKEERLVLEALRTSLEMMKSLARADETAEAPKVPGVRAARPLSVDRLERDALRVAKQAGRAQRKGPDESSSPV